MFKTMWKMPAKLIRRGVEHDGVTPPDEQIASGSLEEMIKAADAIEDDAGEAMVIECVGRDRPITWAEIQGLRHATTFPVDA